MTDSPDDLLKEVAELPNPRTNLLTHNEQVLIDFCQRLGACIEAMQIDARSAALAVQPREGGGELRALVEKWRKQAADHEYVTGHRGGFDPQPPIYLRSCADELERALSTSSAPAALSSPNEDSR